MKMTDCPFTPIDWSKVEPELHPGEQGTASWRTKSCGPLRVRVVDYSPGYVADHWCHKGHVLFVMEGILVTTLSDGREFVLHKGEGYLVADDVAPHKSVTETGVKLFIVD
jgi:hypothetical protein